jgi:hypothetical protein
VFSSLLEATTNTICRVCLVQNAGFVHMREAVNKHRTVVHFLQWLCSNCQLGINILQPAVCFFRRSRTTERNSRPNHTDWGELLFPTRDDGCAFIIPSNINDIGSARFLGSCVDSTGRCLHRSSQSPATARSSVFAMLTHAAVGLKQSSTGTMHNEQRQPASLSPQSVHLSDRVPGQQHLHESSSREVQRVAGCYLKEGID